MARQPLVGSTPTSCIHLHSGAEYKQHEAMAAVGRLMCCACCCRPILQTEEKRQGSLVQECIERPNREVSAS